MVVRLYARKALDAGPLSTPRIEARSRCGCSHSGLFKMPPRLPGWPDVHKIGVSPVQPRQTVWGPLFTCLLWLSLMHKRYVSRPDADQHLDQQACAKRVRGKREKNVRDRCCHGPVCEQTPGRQGGPAQDGIRSWSTGSCTREKSPQASLAVAGCGYFGQTHPEGYQYLISWTRLVFCERAGRGLSFFPVIIVMIQNRGGDPKQGREKSLSLSSLPLTPGDERRRLSPVTVSQPLPHRHHLPRFSPRRAVLTRSPPLSLEAPLGKTAH